MDFTSGFRLDQKQEINQFFRQYGFVVVNDVVEQEQVQQTRDEFFQSAFGTKDVPCEADVKNFWLSKPFGNDVGGLGDQSSLTVAQVNNRQHPHVHKVFSYLFDTEDLIVDHDRLGILLPVVEDAPQLQTKSFLHLDCNPIEGTVDIGGFVKKKGNGLDLEKELVVQAFLALSDAKEENGGFQCVPCSHLFAKSWFYANNRQQVEKEDPIWNHLLRIPVRAGALVIWNTLTFHGNFPNQSKQFRMVQYIRMLPKTNSWALPRFTQLDQYPPGCYLTTLGKSLFGIKE